ncbi:MAG: Asp-tRNA(Asn)/Glu-tRNA(Gln) amidotransferase subunit GatC [Campylobacter sp.]|nr:Asp-tRNA(Asn)/Glu-tRNA(Gln) amidotransferase subunit GatC [Campylobacter sp.]
MVNIDDKLLNKLEKLSALEIPEAKRDDFKKQLSEILGFVEILDELDLSSAKVSVSTLKGGTPLRSDTPTNDPDIVEIILKHAPNTDNHCFVVPKIVE